jgi:hypothetical protein
LEHNQNDYNQRLIEEFRADHQAKTTRQIPVIALERRAS